MTLTVIVVSRGPHALPAKLVATLSASHVLTPKVLLNLDVAPRAGLRNPQPLENSCDMLEGWNEIQGALKFSEKDIRGCSLQRILPVCAAFGAAQGLRALNTLGFSADLNSTGIATVCFRAGPHILAVDQVVLQKLVTQVIDRFCLAIEL